ncbi:histone-lysine N-methyltransferase, H3 lysine-9 specific SUVH5-like [Senna tora]|uniref:Histone-lysine N-methyltransferase, H3 lysine-9 specific SUVH5-like n=1 Tax=Senna tora TaxID=362788 RepID=A0A834WMM6_9FABA|nr:histone-lysine N-methyltransferase, H3 lysine-9 specific SUVH5-like [Senna tora]
MTSRFPVHCSCDSALLRFVSVKSLEVECSVLVILLYFDLVLVHCVNSFLFGISFIIIPWPFKEFLETTLRHNMGPSNSPPRRYNDPKAGDDLSSRKRKWSTAKGSSSTSNQAWQEYFVSQDSGANVKRRKVVELLNMYRELSSKLLHKYEADKQHTVNARRKVWMEVAMCLRQQHKWINSGKQLGPIPGIEVGDQFQCRAELNIVGLHCQYRRGIDFMKKDEVLLATSIVATNRYANVKSSSNSLTYIGHGGNPQVRNVKPTDQKLIEGNLAMMNSMKAKTPVRVVMKVSNSKSNINYIYDGLYIVEKMTQVRGEYGKLVFKFSLTRTSNQPYSFSLRKMIDKPKSSAVAKREVVCSNDISRGLEKFPIRMVTSIRDDDLKPTSFDYIVHNVYHENMHHPMAMLNCCNCIDGCMENKKCACAIKNGGRMPYDYNRKLVAITNSVIFECGSSCKCSTSCINRVTQFGIQFQLEIFKTDLKGWGVRTRSFIPSGSFVCEYVGEVYLDKEAKPQLGADDCSFKIGHKGYINATRRGNVARFINHSCSPNLFVKDVLYDDDDKRFPHKMLFAVNNIPAGRELCFDYNCMKGKSNEQELRSLATDLNPLFNAMAAGGNEMQTRRRIWAFQVLPLASRFRTRIRLRTLRVMGIVLPFRHTFYTGRVGSEIVIGSMVSNNNSISY